MMRKDFNQLKITRKHLITWSLLMRGLKLLGSLLNVIPSISRNLFMPETRVCGVLAMVLMEGVPSNTITRSARYVAMMKSCSTMNAVFLACMMKRLMTYG